MFKSPLKVYGEYLLPVAAASASMVGANVVRAGASMSGLEVVVCVEPLTANPDVGLDIADGDEITITILHSQDGEVFVAMPESRKTFTADETFKPGDILHRVTLPYDCLPFIKGKLEFSAAPAGNVSMFPAYLPR